VIFVSFVVRTFFAEGENMHWEPIDERDEALAHQVIGAGIEVHRFLGPGLLESIYSKAMEHELRTAGLVVEREKEILVPYKDIQISGQRLDLLVGGRIIVEHKAVESIAPICIGSAEMGQTGLLVKLETGNKDCEWIYRFWANPGSRMGGIVPPAPVLAPGSALRSRPRVALSSAQAPSM
jgi:GxxExxY protein